MYWTDYIKTYKIPENLTLPFKKNGEIEYEFRRFFRSNELSFRRND